MRNDEVLTGPNLVVGLKTKTVQPGVRGDVCRVWKKGGGAVGTDLSDGRGEDLRGLLSDKFGWFVL